MASAKGYLARGSIQRFRRYLETVKELGICWFDSNNGHQQAGSVNTFTDSGSKKCGVLSKGFLASKSKPVYRSNCAQLGSGYPESRRGSTPQGFAFDSRLIGSKLSPIAQIIQVAETAAYRRMLVRIQLERLSFVGEMIYPTVELNFRKTIIC